MSSNRRKHITSQHYDHSYTKHIIIDCVNDECLAEIFTYVPICERPKIALVCKKWKRALNNSWFNVKKIELTYWRYHEYSNCLNKYQTSDEKLNFLRSLLDKCGRYLTVLDLTAYGHCDIVPVVNDSCPNLVRLRLRFVSIDNAMLFNAFTRLTKLKSLTIVFGKMKGKVIPSTLINSLRNVADTLTKLSLLHLVDQRLDRCYNSKELLEVFPDLKAINSFETVGILFQPGTLMSLRGDRVSFFLHHSYLAKPPIRTKPLIKVKALVLDDIVLSDESLYFIANSMEQLEILSIYAGCITDHGVETLSKMHHLRCIRFRGPSNITDSSIKLLKNMHKIVFPRSKKITEVSVMKIIENSPDLDYFSLKDTVVTADFFKKAAQIANSRKKLVTYVISPPLPDLEQYESPYFERYIPEYEQTSAQVPT